MLRISTYSLRIVGLASLAAASLACGASTEPGTGSPDAGTLPLPQNASTIESPSVDSSETARPKNDTSLAPEQTPPRAQTPDEVTILDFDLRPPVAVEEYPIDADLPAAVLFNDRWFVPSCECSIAYSVQLSPPPDADLFKIESVGQFTTALGTWSLIDVGGGENIMAMLNTGVYVVQVGGTGASEDLIQQFANAVELEVLQ